MKQTMTLTTFEDAWKYIELPTIERSFPKSVAQKVLNDRLDQVITNCRKMIDEEYQRYKELAIQGVPLKDRQEKVEKKINWCQEFIKKMEVRKQEEIPDYADWMEWGDYQQMKRMGFKRFIEVIGETRII